MNCFFGLGPWKTPLSLWQKSLEASNVEPVHPRRIASHVFAASRLLVFPQALAFPVATSDKHMWHETEA